MSDVVVFLGNRSPLHLTSPPVCWYSHVDHIVTLITNRRNLAMPARTLQLRSSACNNDRRGISQRWRHDARRRRHAATGRVGTCGWRRLRIDEGGPGLMTLFKRAQQCGLMHYAGSAMLPRAIAPLERPAIDERSAYHCGRGGGYDALLEQRRRHAVSGRRAGNPAAGWVGALLHNLAALLGVAGLWAVGLGWRRPGVWAYHPDNKTPDASNRPNTGPETAKHMAR